MTVRFPRPAALPPASARLVVVEASAGTGKTYFLEHRVADLIVAGAALDDILVVTFTDKAVAELRTRIRDLLDRMARAEVSCDDDDAWQLDAATRARLRAATIAFDRAQIFTIHGFCHRVLVEDAFAARRLFEQTQVADEVAFDAAFDTLLATRFARSEPDRSLLAAYLASEQSVDQLRALLLRCARTNAAPPRSYDEEAIHAIGAALRAAFAAASPIGLDGYERKYLVGIVEALSHAAADAPRVLASFDAARAPARKLAERLAEKGHGTPALARAVADLLAAMSLEEAIVARFLQPIRDQARSDKTERGWFDYDDMLVLVRDALADPTGGRGDALAARLRARTPYALIDEFQDTDTTQWQIFRRVWLHDDARTLTIVGDPKQAIYGFRGADVHAYLRARDELLALGATRVTLADNRRSREALVRAVDAVLAGDADGPLLDPRFGIAYNQPARAASDLAWPDAGPPIVMLEVGEPADRDTQQGAIADTIACEIERLRASPPSWRARGRDHTFTLADAMVLTRKNDESVAIAAALRARGLAAAVIESERLFRTREAADVLDVLDAIASPRDRSARLRALRTRFFGVPWQALASVVDAPDHHPAIARLHDWAQLAQRRAYEPLFRQLVDHSGLVERAHVLGGGERAIVNTWHVLELLLEQLALARCDLHELATRLRRWIADDTGQADDRDVQRLDHDGDAVRVMTIHKAKGLEAPFVFVFGGTSGVRPTTIHTLREGDQRVLAVDPHDLAVAERARAEDDAELQRLAYVALTRAQLRLYLPRYAEGAYKARVLYASIQRCMVAAAAREPTLFATVDVPLASPATAPATPALLAQLDIPAPPARHELPALPVARTQRPMWSYTRLARSTEVLDEPQDEIREPIALAPDELPPGARSGIFVHDLLERADLAMLRATSDADAWLHRPQVKAWLVERARACGVDPRYVGHAGALVHRTLAAPLQLVDGSARPPLCEAAALARELEFAYPIPGELQRGFLRGFIDALVAWDDALWVVDYKSDLLGADPIAAARARASDRNGYGLQARIYALAAHRLAGSRTLAGVLFAFVRHGVVAAIETPDHAIEAWTDELANADPQDRR
jgi:exodeoxyribonuclease V beta subunit